MEDMYGEGSVSNICCCESFYPAKLEGSMHSRLCYLCDCCQLTGEHFTSLGGAPAFGKRSAFRGQGSCSSDTTVHTPEPGGAV